MKVSGNSDTGSGEYGVEHVGYRSCYQLGPTQQSVHMMADPGLLLVALALRRSDVFQDYADLDALLDGRERIIRFKPEVIQPVFVGGAPGGWVVNTDLAMTYHSFYDFFKKNLVRAGFPGELVLVRYT